MAEKNKNQANITRIKATDSKSAKKVTKESRPAATKTESFKTASARFNPFAAIIGYFKGSWFELKQVRWPTRKATWGLTVAFFVVLILLLDAGFKYLFEIILG
ncbi:MAG: preprotein translocase subunit SecE [Candidatus Saccharibacteria bacterium]